ncbi:hypothetical protein AAFF_G00073010 [Aldrovandia affinis]|uniref:Uncharacterized protein n=1 Tax=Aldrovandia affinis TaxID=143900 RepID=A0AAD7RYB7_9TELE|nr:hypothetical protein AAFF_G00073010 [Aldrovandia affinis]
MAKNSALWSTKVVNGWASNRKIPYGLHFQRQRDRPVLRDSVPEEVNRGQPELALSRIDNQAMLAEALKESPEIPILKPSLESSYHLGEQKTWMDRF